MEVILSRVYSSLIDLYKTVNKKLDSMFTVKIEYVSSCCCCRRAPMLMINIYLFLVVSSLSAVTMKEIGIKPAFWLGWKPDQVSIVFDSIQ
jgi:hypothetical protein